VPQGINHACRAVNCGQYRQAAGAVADAVITFFELANEALHSHIVAMQDTKRSSESVLERKERLEISISEALEREAVRHAAAVKNMHRLRALRLERDQKAERK